VCRSVGLRERVAASLEYRQVQAERRRNLVAQCVGHQQLAKQHGIRRVELRACPWKQREISRQAVALEQEAAQQREAAIVTLGEQRVLPAGVAVSDVADIARAVV